MTPTFIHQRGAVFATSSLRTLTKKSLRCKAFGSALDIHFSSVLQLLLLAEVNAQPMRLKSEFADSLRKYGILVDKHFVGRVFKAWGYSCKNGKFLQRNKFTKSNMRYVISSVPAFPQIPCIRYYISYVPAIRQIPWHLAHFLDEASYADIGESLAVFLPAVDNVCSARVRGYTEQGRALRVQRGGQLGAVQPTVTVTVVTNLRANSGFWVSNPRMGSNNALDFLECVVDLLDQQVSESERDWLTSFGSRCSCQAMYSCSTTPASTRPTACATFF